MYIHIKTIYLRTSIPQCFVIKYGKWIIKYLESNIETFLNFLFLKKILEHIFENLEEKFSVNQIKKLDNKIIKREY